MDISKLSHGIKLVLGASIAFLIVSIFNWQEIDLGIVSGGVSMWHGWGVLAGLLAIAIIVWEGLRLANMKIEIGLTPAMVTAALAICCCSSPSSSSSSATSIRTFWAWLGLLLAIFVAVGAFMNMKELGHSLEDMGNEMKAAAGSAAAAAKACDGQGRRWSAPPLEAPAAPAAPEAPAAPAAPAAPEAPRRACPLRASSLRLHPPDPIAAVRPLQSRGRTPRYTARMAETGTMRVKSGLAEMLKGGVIMDVVNAEQAVIAENAGACAVMALERVPADIRRDGGVARMSDPA